MIHQRHEQRSRIECLPWFQLPMGGEKLQVQKCSFLSVVKVRVQVAMASSERGPWKLPTQYEGLLVNLKLDTLIQN